MRRPSRRRRWCWKVVYENLVKADLLVVFNVVPGCGNTDLVRHLLLDIANGADWRTAVCQSEPEPGCSQAQQSECRPEPRFVFPPQDGGHDMGYAIYQYEIKNAESSANLQECRRINRPQTHTPCSGQVDPQHRLARERFLLPKNAPVHEHSEAVVRMLFYLMEQVPFSRATKVQGFLAANSLVQQQGFVVVEVLPNS